jgi:hypothetical protein
LAEFWGGPLYEQAILWSRGYLVEWVTVLDLRKYGKTLVRVGSWQASSALPLSCLSTFIDDPQSAVSIH